MLKVICNSLNTKKLIQATLGKSVCVNQCLCLLTSSYVCFSLSSPACEIKQSCTELTWLQHWDFSPQHTPSASCLPVWQHAGRHWPVDPCLLPTPSTLCVQEKISFETTLQLVLHGFPHSCDAVALVWCDSLRVVSCYSLDICVLLLLGDSVK